MKKLTKLISAVGTEMFLLASQVSATAFTADDFSAASGNESVNTIMGKISGFVKPIAAILIFGSVLMVGFEIIMKRNKADDRMASMSSLMWVGIGTLVIAFAALIASFIFTGVTEQA